MTRRSLLASSLALAVPAFADDATLPIHRAVEYEMLPKDASISDKLQIAKQAGFERVECPTMADQKEADEVKKAAEAAGLKIHSVMNMGHWEYPLTSSDSAVVEKSIEIAKTSIRNAHFWGADTVLIVPGVVTEKTSYKEAYERSQVSLKKLLPLAEQLRVTIAVEEVWNKFLLSPLEFAHYVDGFNSPYLKAYFDVGNVQLYGYPADWIRTLGPRIAKLHIKDFFFRKQSNGDGRLAEFVPLLEGDIDWRAVYEALRDVKYQGTATLELEGGDLAYLTEMNKRFVKILNGTAKSVNPAQ